MDKTKSYYLFFDKAIDAASMHGLRQQLANLVEAGVSEITLVIDSAGGLVDPTLITYSSIQALPARISTHAQGFVQSAATLLFLVGQERSADRNARFLFHPAQSMMVGVMGEQQIRERLTGFDAVADMMAQIYHGCGNRPLQARDGDLHRQAGSGFRRDPDPSPTCGYPVRARRRSCSWIEIDGSPA